MADQQPTDYSQYGPSDYVNLFKHDDFNRLPVTEQLKRLSTIQPVFDTWDEDKYGSFRKSLGVPLQGKLEAPQSLKDKIIETARPFVAPAVGAVAGAAATPTGPLGMGIAGAGASVLVDQALQAAEDRKPVSPIFGLDGIGNTAEMLGTNEIGGRIGDKIIGKLKGVLSEYNTPGSVVGSIAKLQPTFSQYYQQTFGSQSVSKWVEDIFASGSKAAAIENSGKIAMFEGTALGSRLAKRTPGVVSNPLRMGQNMAVGLENNLKTSYAESEGLSSTAKLVGKANVIQIPMPPEPPGKNPIVQKAITALGGSGDFNALPPQAQSAVLSLAKNMGYSPVQPKPLEIAGPVHLENARQIAQQFVDDRMKLFPDITKAPPEDQQLINAAKTILGISSPMQFPDGSVVKMPVSFEDAWNVKKATDRFAYGDPHESVSYTSSTFAKLSKAINQDIDDSIPLWQNNPNGVATKAWQNAKATVAQRYNVFGEDGVKQLINTTNSPVPEIDKIMADPVKLQRALNAGELKMPSGTIASSNMRKDLQGYKVMTMLQDAWKGDPINPQVGTIQPEKLMGSWNDPAFGEGKKLLFSQQQRADIDQFFKNIAMTQQKQSFGGVPSKVMWAVRGGIAFSPALFTGAMTGSADWGLGVLGVTASGMAASRLLTSPTMARMMVAMSAGQPVGRSTEYISRQIVGALQGTGALISIQNKDGKKIDGTIDKDGKFTPSQP